MSNQQNDIYYEQLRENAQEPVSVNNIAPVVSTLRILFRILIVALGAALLAIFTFLLVGIIYYGTNWS